MKRKYTIVVPLNYKNNKELIDYFEKEVSKFSQMERKLFYIFRSNIFININNLNKKLQSEYSVSKRTANSAIKDIKGRVKALTELKKREIKQKEHKIESLEKEIFILSERVNKYKNKLQNKEKIDLVNYRNLKRKYISKKIRLNKFKDRLSSLKWRLENNKLKLCFGSKRLLKQNFAKFIEQRDSQMSYVGSYEETACNQMLQLTYVNKINQFIIKLRRDFEYKNAKGNEKYVYGKCYFSFNKNKIIEILKNKTSPLTYSIIRKNNRYYLHCTFEIENDIKNFITRRSYGTLGIDFNKGFIAVSETNEFGSLVDTYTLKYRFGKGNKTDNDFKQIINQVVKKAIKVGKDVIIESLDFIDKKAKTTKGKSKKGLEYNNMLHSLAYSKFSDIIDNICFKNRVTLIKVNPAYTSKIGKEKYTNSMKLNIHNAASYVIARRGMKLVS